MLIATIKSILSSIRTTAETADINMDTLYQVSASANDTARRYRAKQFLEATAETAELKDTMDLLENQRITNRQNLLK